MRDVLLVDVGTLSPLLDRFRGRQQSASETVCLRFDRLAAWLIGCGKKKRAERVAARDLYTGPLFRARREYAEATGAPWYVVSAKYGLLSPDQGVGPYDLTIKDLCEPDRAAWALCTIRAVLDDLTDDTHLREVILEVHAGADYAEPLVEVARAAGFSTDWPVQGLGIGEQRAWYVELTRQARLGMRRAG